MSSFWGGKWELFRGANRHTHAGELYMYTPPTVSFTQPHGRLINTINTITSTAEPDSPSMELPQMPRQEGSIHPPRPPATVLHTPDPLSPRVNHP